MDVWLKLEKDEAKATQDFRKLPMLEDTSETKE